MVWKCICFFAIYFMILFSAASAEDLNLRFAMRYATVQHSLKGDNGEFDRLMGIADKEPDAYQYLANFWWRRSLNSCKSEMDRAIETSLKEWSKQNPGKKNPTDKQSEKILENMFKEIDPLIDSYIYDHWDEINEMIVARWEQINNGER